MTTHLLFWQNLMPLVGKIYLRKTSLEFHKSICYQGEQNYFFLFQ